MLCENNLFCASLAPETRDELCRHCSKRTLTAGSMLLSEDFSLKVNLVIEGAMSTDTDFSGDLIREPYDVPSFFLVTSGILFPLEVLFMRKMHDQLAYSVLHCLTDCTIARFDLDVVLGMFNSDPGFARSVLLNQITTSAHASMFAATLRSYDVYQGVKWLLYFLSDKGIILTHQQIAELTTHNRTSVTKAIGAIKRREPELWQRYQEANASHELLCFQEATPSSPKSKLPTLKKVLNYLTDIDIHIHPERCIHVRNKNVACNACKNACPGNALSTDGFNVAIRPDSCLLCGACVASCPFDVFSAHNPSTRTLLEQVQQSAELTDGNPLVVCGHTHTDLMGTYAPHVVRLNCLGRLDENFYATAASMGLKSITLVHGNCKECPRSASGAQARRIFQAAQTLLFSWEREIALYYTNNMPTEAYAYADSKSTKAVKSQRSIESAETYLLPPSSNEDWNLSAPSEKHATERERVRALATRIRAKDGILPRHPFPRPGRVYDQLRQTGTVPDEMPAQRFWGIPTFNTTRCKQCGLCAQFCEAGAIKKVEEFDYRRKRTLYAFEVTPLLCARCGCCEQVCQNKAIRIKPLDSTESMQEPHQVVLFESPDRSQSKTYS